MSRKAIIGSARVPENVPDSLWVRRWPLEFTGHSGEYLSELGMRQRDRTIPNRGHAARERIVTATLERTVQ